MKKTKIAFSLVILALLAGCTTGPQVVVNQAVGPDLAPPRMKLPSKGEGQLIVYTETGVTDPPDTYYPTHSAYVIYTSDGNLLRRVDNRAGSFSQDAVKVSLPAGTYKVKGRATNSGQVTVPVIIKEDKITVVDLQGTNLPQHKPTGAGQWIRLPNGQVIGMRAE
jgi:hypothetical protein